MSSIHLLVPTSSLSYAYAQGRKNLLEGAPPPLSAKRMKYGVPAAVSLQDLLDEQDVVDSTDWAKAMVNVHPEMLSADPKSASHIQNNLIVNIPTEPAIRTRWTGHAAAIRHSG
jgi:hypothetical protein